MELQCPSCGTVHNTEDHPAALEIACQCGHSILVPEEQGSEAQGFEPNFETGQSASEGESPAEEAPENPLQEGDPEAEAQSEFSQDEYSPNEHTQLPESEEPIQGEPGSPTPPGELPEGMIYDRWELEQLENEAVKAGPNLFKGSEKNEEKRAENFGQAIVERTQAVAMGQLLGPSYRVSWERMPREKLVQLTKRLEKMLQTRPWLETELRSRKIDLEKIPELSEIDQVPELVAVEIYLACFELGGFCHFESRPNL